MKTYTLEEVMQMHASTPGALDYDNQGQLVFYTNIFRWQDGTYRDQIDPSIEEE